MAVVIPNRPGTFVFADPTAGLVGSVVPPTFNTCYMVVDAATGTANQLSAALTSVAEFTAAFGASNATNYVTTLFELYPGIRLRCVRAGSTATPVVADYTAAVNSAAFNRDLSPGFLIAPSAFGALTNQADRTTLFQAMNTLAETLRWIALIDTGSATTTVAAAIAESDLYRAAKRYSALYYSLGMSAVAAATALRGFAEIGQFTPPAGRYEIPQTVITRHSLKTVTAEEQELLAPKRINPLRLINGRVVIYDAQTLATDLVQAPSQINSLVAVSIIERSLEQTYSVFEALQDDDDETLTRQVVDVMETLFGIGALRRNVRISDGRQLDKGYAVERATVLSDTAREVIVGYTEVSTLRQIVIRTARLAAA